MFKMGKFVADFQGGISLEQILIMFLLYYPIIRSHFSKKLLCELREKD